MHLLINNLNDIFVFSTLNVNSRGIVRASQAAAKNMISEKIKGSIVNISSTISEVITYR
jgi:NAD(P)-dependent dehydrogenase (short-subunit alcohol dehydrogenase family)